MPTSFRVDDTNVAWRVADDEAVVLHADSSAYFGLNPTGTLLWAQLAEHSMTLEQLTAWAGSGFPDAPADLAEVMSGFLDELLELNLIEGTESTDPAASPAALEATMVGEVPSWETPAVERFGDLEKLILSGE